MRRILCDYDLFQFENRIKPDYCNACELEMFEEGEWISWHHPETDIGFDEHCRSL